MVSKERKSLAPNGAAHRERRGVPSTPKDRKLAFGFRAGATIWFSLPATLLNTVVPLFAIYRGDVTLPNVMISDIMAAHPLYSSFFCWGLTITMAGVCYVFQESGVLWRREMPEACYAVDRFLVILHLLNAPTLFGLVAFQYKEDMSLSSLSSLPLMDMLTNFEFILWFAHVSFTGVFFLSACFNCGIYVCQVKPAIEAHQLTHSGDRFWMSMSTGTAFWCLPFGVVVRFSHLLIGGNLCGVLLVVIEIVMIQCFVVAAFAGSFQLMMERDAESPISLWGRPLPGDRPHSE